MDGRLNEGVLNRSRFPSGFTLIEVVWAVLLLTVMALGLMALASQAVRAHRTILDSRIATIRTWNQATDFQAGRTKGEVFAPIPGRRPMQRLTLTNSEGRKWEVLRAGK